MVSKKGLFIYRPLIIRNLNKSLEMIPEEFETIASQYLSEKRVLDVEFSSGTYQFEIEDISNKQRVFPFIQFDTKENIGDLICSCSQAEEQPFCEHLAAAIAFIYQDSPQPLHVRFYHSFWYKLCELFEKRFGSDPTIIHTDNEGRFFLPYAEPETAFDIQCLDKNFEKKIYKTLFHRKIETEETSIKFFNLSSDDIRKWKEGRPNENLRFELSFWSDLAKLFMLLQHEHQLESFEFEYNEEELPHIAIVQFSQILHLRAYFPKGPLIQLIPYFQTVPSPLEIVIEEESHIRKITYNKEKQEFQVHYKDEIEKPITASPQVHAIQLEKWEYIPKQGFYFFDQSLQKKKLCKDLSKVFHSLEHHIDLLHKYLEGSSLNLYPVTLNYEIYFDSNWNLHLKAYLFKPKDLQTTHSTIFGNWVYLENDGFYKLEPPPFHQIHTRIHRKDVSEFVTQNRGWLNTKKGFETHLINLESHLTYTVTSNLALEFHSHTEIPMLGKQYQDFQEWVYVENHGFYSKLHGKQNHHIPPGTKVTKEKIAEFIKKNEEELAHIPGFFYPKNPIQKAGISIYLEKDRSIFLEPTFQYTEGYQEQDVILFDKYTYVPKQGFYELPAAFDLPKEFRKPKMIPEKNLQYFLSIDLPRLKPFIIYLDPKLQSPKEGQWTLLELKPQENESHYPIEANIVWMTEKGQVPFFSIYEAMQKKEDFLFSEAGLLDLAGLPFDWVHTLNKNQIHPQSIYLTSLQFFKCYIINEINDQFLQIPEQQHFYQSLIHLQPPSKPSKSGLKCKLRPYQKIGVNWLWFLYCHGLSGILCDDMGLGKTLQTIALMAAIKAHRPETLKETGKRPKKKFLVICPTSVIFHWEEKIKQFFPNLKVLTFYGLNRSLTTFKQKCDLLLTSYGILRMEQESLKQLSFTLAVFDEMQIAKNSKSQTFQALTQIQSKVKLGLTGTPIENSLRELKSLFDLVLPGLMPPDTIFKEYFINPIEKENDAKKRATLKQFIKPFILRRKKSEVLSELPEKTVELSYCELSTEQASLYQKHLYQFREGLIKELEDESKPIPYMHIFSLLNSLKQICNHPACGLGQPKDYKKYPSGKWDLFIELLDEAKESSQKVVVFSQYLSMLDIIEYYLKENHINYATIRGSTTNRKEQLEKFQKDPNCLIFVASLKAVGLGVDLTAASIVIHYDRWWNAAREDQATDRVHRMGQTRGVQVFKLITKDTLEEKIDRIIEKKGRLMEEVVTSDSEDQIKIFNRQDLIQLLEFSPGLKPPHSS